MKYGVAGDQFAGRVLFGLPVHSSRFAVLPPHFVYNEEWPKERVNEVMSSVAQENEQVTPQRVMTMMAEQNASLTPMIRGWFTSLTSAMNLDGDISFSPDNSGDTTGSRDEVRDEWEVFEWKDRVDRVVPHDWSPPLQTSWPRGVELWFPGIPSDRIGPFRDMRPSDMLCEKARYRLSDCRATFVLLESFLHKSSGRAGCPSVFCSSADRPSVATARLSLLKKHLHLADPLMEEVCNTPKKSRKQYAVPRKKPATVGKRLRGKQGESLLKRAVAKVKCARTQGSDAAVA